MSMQFLDAKRIEKDTVITVALYEILHGLGLDVGLSIRR